MKYCLWMLMIFSALAAVGQSEEAITDDELKNYAVVMDSIEDMRKSLLDNMSDAIKNNDQITAARYNELSKIISDSVKLQTVNATDAEINAVKKVITDRDEGAAKIQDTFKSLVKDLLGAATYNKVKKALSSDAELKVKYQTMLEEINKAEDEGNKADGE